MHKISSFIAIMLLTACSYTVPRAVTQDKPVTDQVFFAESQPAELPELSFYMKATDNRPPGPGSLGKYRPYSASSDSGDSSEEYREGAAKVIRHFVKVRHAAKRHIEAIYDAVSVTGTVDRRALRQALETYNNADRIIQENWSVYKYYGGTANSVYEL